MNPEECTAWCRELTEWSEAARLLNSDLIDLGRRLYNSDDPSFRHTASGLARLRGELDRLAFAAHRIADAVGQCAAGASPMLAEWEATTWNEKES
jgi:hypothetical protein